MRPSAASARSGDRHGTIDLCALPQSRSAQDIEKEWPSSSVGDSSLCTFDDPSDPVLRVPLRDATDRVYEWSRARYGGQHQGDE